MLADARGDHFAACMRSGRVKLRAHPVENVVAQICREAGARVRQNVLLRDLNVSVSSRDERRIEVIASGLPVLGGAQLAVDVTLRSVLSRDGAHRPNADWKDGACAEAARRDKEATYPELVDGSRCKLVVLALEVGGRIGSEALTFLEQLGEAKYYVDPALHSRRRYVRFIRKLTTVGLVSCSRTYRCRIGVFAVAKKMEVSA